MDSLVTQIEQAKVDFAQHKRPYAMSAYAQSFSIIQWNLEQIQSYSQRELPEKHRERAMAGLHRAIMGHWREVVKARLSISKMEHENYDVVADSLKEDLRIVPLDPSKPTLKKQVNIVSPKFQAVRDYSDVKNHRAYHWELELREEVVYA